MSAFRAASPAFVLAAILLLPTNGGVKAQPVSERVFESPNAQEFGFFGQVAAVSDADGDGFGDFLVGANNEADATGRAYLYSGATGELLLTLQSPAAVPRGFGAAVASVPDADGDGRSDLLVGAPFEDVGEEGGGRAYLFSGATGDLLSSFESPNRERSNNFGTSVAGVPDVDGDGRGDVVIADRGERVDDARPGRAYVYSGATGALLWVLDGSPPADSRNFGWSVAGLPDVDGDGRGDVAVGSEDDTELSRAGRVFVYSGASGARLHALESPTPNFGGFFGNAVAGVPDIDGDGRGDLLVGALGENAAGVVSSGRAHLVSGATGAVIHTLQSPAPSEYGGFGHAVSGIPDVDDDGVPDLVVGASGEDGGASRSGRVYLFSGATGLRIRTYRSLHPESGGSFGVRVAGVPDANGNGRGELLVGAINEDGGVRGTGRAYAFYPGLDTLVVTVTGDGADYDLEDRRCDAVTDAEEADDQCTLRAAIQEAHIRNGAFIAFEIPPTDPGCRDGVCVIRPAASLPALRVPVTIDGTTQPDAAIHLVGEEAPDGATGLIVVGPGAVVVRGLAITGFAGWGLQLGGGRGHQVEQAVIGFMPGERGGLAPNEAGGIEITEAAADVTIGGEAPAAANRIFGGVVIRGATPRGIHVRRNELAVSTSAAGVARVPIDIDAPGPSCVSWPDGAGSGMPPPRLLSITATVVQGRTQPGAEVVIYQVKGAGGGRGRYWPAQVVPVGLGTADAEGAFSVTLDEPLGATALVTATATNAAGNTSELAQLKRPVVYVPGIGGSWLIEASTGQYIWVPITVDNKNDRLARMSMLEDGRSLWPVDVDGIVELGGFAAYGPALASIRAIGYPDDLGRGASDLWHFPYDWRTNTADRAHDLRALVDELTGGAEDVAISCEVDLVAHSNGGLVSSVYVRRDAEHAQNRVHRFITVASPYLGASKAAAAHSIGYVFDIEKALHFEVDWGRMIQMARNLPGTYGLMPSRAFWKAANPDSPSHRHGFQFQDLDGKRLRSYDATAAFLAADKVDASGAPRGLARNGALYASQQEEVHDLIDDWRGWEGPPQVFRQVGALPASTPTGWQLWPLMFRGEDFPVRREPGDTRLHQRWRERVIPILGTGDETVPLLSAGLGGDPEVSAIDYSGVESPWIEASQYYLCTHTGIITEGCRERGGAREALPAVQRMLRSGYMVLPDEPAARAAKAPAETPGAELLYVVASGPVTVTVTDGAGNITGPASAEEFQTILYDVPDISYWPGTYGTVVSVPTGRTYTLTVGAPVEEVTARVYRVQVEAADAMRRSILFADHDLAAGGALRLALAPEGTPASAPLAVDADADGVFEGTLAPQATLQGSVGYPAVPAPAPAAIRAAATGDGPISVEVAMPDVGAEGWTWTLDESASWITPSATSGAAPATIVLELAADSIADTLATSSLTFTLAYEAYAVEVDVPVELRIGAFAVAREASAPVPGALALEVYPNPVRRAATIELTTPQAGPARVELYDLLGRQVAVLHDGPLAAGTHRLVLDVSQRPAGLYVLRVVTPTRTLTRRLTAVP